MIRDDVRAVIIGKNCFRVGEANTFTGWPVDADSHGVERTVTRIAISERNGQMAPIRWVEIWAGDLLWIEIDSSQCQGIEYNAPA